MKIDTTEITLLLTTAAPMHRYATFQARSTAQRLHLAAILPTLLVQAFAREETEFTESVLANWNALSEAVESMPLE